MSEYEEQVAVIEYCELLGIPVYHIPNEGKRSVYYAQKLKRSGLRAGVPDLCIPVARGGFHGLYIEMKAKGGKVTPKQREWIGLLRAQGMAVYVCYGAENARRLVDAYMAGDL